MMKMRKNESGFTLVELMIVVAIIGILAAIAIPQFQAYRTRSYNANAKGIVHLATGSQSDLNAELGTFGNTEGAAAMLTAATGAAGVNDSSAIVALAIAATGTTAGGRLAGTNNITTKDFAVPFGIGANMIAQVVADAAAPVAGLSYHAYARHFNGDTAYAIDSDAATRIYSVSHPTWPGNPALLAAPAVPAPNIDEFQAAPGGGGSPTLEWLPAS